VSSIAPTDRYRAELERVDAEMPDVVSLAMFASLAVRVESQLLRRLRRTLLPLAHAGIEADLWFSPLVQTRGADAITLVPELAELMRERLARRRNDLMRAGEITRQSHGHLPPVLRLEEEIIWAVMTTENAEPVVNECFARALNAIVIQGREGISRWALEALPRLPKLAQQTVGAWLLLLHSGPLAVAPVVLNGEPPRELFLEGLFSVAAAHLPRRTIHAHLDSGVLTVDSTEHGAGMPLSVPDTSPRVLFVRWVRNSIPEEAGVAVWSGQVLRRSIDAAAVVIVTIDGREHRLESAPEKKVPAVVKAPVHRWRMHVVRAVGKNFPEYYDIAQSPATLGRRADVALAHDEYCHDRVAIVTYDGQRLTVRDLGRINGVHLRIRKPTVVRWGDVFVIGDSLLRVDENPLVDDAPDADRTYFYSSPRWPSAFRVTQLLNGGRVGGCTAARGTTCLIGSAIGDFILSGDPLVDTQHCLLEEASHGITVTDLSSRSGTFVRLHGEHEIEHGDELLVGRTRLVVDLPRGPADGTRRA
jgi:hypothetical protein